MYERSEIEKAVRVLKKGGVILYPTDTVWGIGCDATNERAVRKIYNIKAKTSTSLIILVSDTDQLKKYVSNVPGVAIDLIRGIEDPLTIIYKKGKNIAKNVMAPDGSIAIRIPKHPFCHDLLKAFGKPLTSTSANISGDSTPLSFSRVSNEIKKSVDHITAVDKYGICRSRPSTIVKLHDDGEIGIIRS